MAREKEIAITPRKLRGDIFSMVREREKGAEVASAVPDVTLFLSWLHVASQHSLRYESEVLILRGRFKSAVLAIHSKKL